MYKLSRHQSRQFFFDTWHKYHHQELLSDMEKIALNIILLHPEYHSILDDTERYHDKDYPPEMGNTNPFLHMSMHIAIKEQLSIDQPSGIKERFNRLQKKNKMSTKQCTKLWSALLKCCGKHNVTNLHRMHQSTLNA